jgi:hypothetical protein
VPYRNVSSAGIGTREGRLDPHLLFPYATIVGRFFGLPPGGVFGTAVFTYRSLEQRRLATLGAGHRAPLLIHYEHRNQVRGANLAVSLVGESVF